MINSNKDNDTYYTRKKNFFPYTYMYKMVYKFIIYLYRYILYL